MLLWDRFQFQRKLNLVCMALKESFFSFFFFAKEILSRVPSFLPWTPSGRQPRSRLQYTNVGQPRNTFFSCVLTRSLWDIHWGFNSTVNEIHPSSVSLAPSQATPFHLLKDASSTGKSFSLYTEMIRPYVWPDALEVNVPTCWKSPQRMFHNSLKWQITCSNHDTVRVTWKKGAGAAQRGTAGLGLTQTSSLPKHPHSSCSSFKYK